MKEEIKKLIWYECPSCRQKLFMMTEDAVIKGVEIKCKKCKKIIKVSR